MLYLTFKKFQNRCFLNKFFVLTFLASVFQIVTNYNHEIFCGCGLNNTIKIKWLILLITGCFAICTVELWFWITGVQDALNTVNGHGGFPLPNVLIPLHLLVCFHSKSNSKSKPVPLTASSFIWKIKIITTLLCFHNIIKRVLCFI